MTVPGETVPHKIQRGQVSEYDGWVLPTPLFNELAPCFKERLENLPATEPVGEPIDLETKRPWLKFPGEDRR